MSARAAGLRSSPTPCSSGRSPRSSSSSPSSWPTTPTTACRSCRRASCNVQVANGAELVKGNEVRSGGFRIGIVDDMKPVRLPNGRVGAELQAQARPKLGAVPVDRRSIIRPRSALGLKYVELQRGHAQRRSPTAALLPAAQTRSRSSSTSSTTCSTRRRARPRRTTSRLRRRASPAAAADLNATIARAPALFGAPAPVMRNLADPQHATCRTSSRSSATPRASSRRSRRSTRTCSPTMADTFEAISRDPQALQGHDRQEPADARRRRSQSLRVQRPFLARHRGVLARPRAPPGDLRGALPTLNRALERRHAGDAPLGRPQRRAAGRHRRAAATSPRRRRPTARCAA